MTAGDAPRPLRVFVAGGSGAIGKRLVPRLAAEGYFVAAMTRSCEKVDALRRLGANPIVCDAFRSRGGERGRDERPTRRRREPSSPSCPRAV